MIENKLSKLFGKITLHCFLFIFLFIPISNAAERTKVIEAEEFRLVDRDGRVTAEIKSTQNGPVIIVYDRGTPKVIKLDAISGVSADDGFSTTGGSIEAKAKSLIDREKYDEAINLLSKPVSQDPMNFDLSLLLLRAEVERCALLKEKGDISYKYTVKGIYQRGLTLYNRNRTHPEPYYIVAKSLYVNDRHLKAHETVKKAVYYSPNDPYYLQLQGDICIELMKTAGEGKKHSYDRGYSQKQKLYNEAMGAYERALTFNKANKNPALKQQIDTRIAKANDLWKEIDK